MVVLLLVVFVLASLAPFSPFSSFRVVHILHSMVCVPSSLSFDLSILSYLCRLLSPVRTVFVATNPVFVM